VLIRQIAIGTAVLSGVALVGSGIWYGTRIDALTIDEVAVSGGETVTHEAIEEAANDALAGAYFALIPHRFAWTYPEEEIKEAVAREPRVKDVSVVRDGQELSISFSEYAPSALWCGEKTDDRCLFLDATGYAFAEAPELSGGTFLRYVDPSREPAIGAYAYTGTTGVDFLSFAATLHEHYGFTVTHVEQDAEDELTYRIAGGGLIKTSLRITPEDTLANLDTVLASDEFTGLSSGSFGYIDLRYGDRVFVREASGEGSPILATSTPSE
jgi:cell division septal protein FtsQ